MAFHLVDIEPDQFMSVRVKSKQLFINDLSVNKDGSHLKIAAGSLPLYGVADMSILLDCDDDYAKEMGAAIVEAARRVNDRYGLPTS